MIKTKKNDKKGYSILVPVWDLKCSFKSRILIETAIVSEIFLSKPTGERSR